MNTPVATPPTKPVQASPATSPARPHRANARTLPVWELAAHESGLGSSFFNLLLVPVIELNLSLPLSPLGVTVVVVVVWRVLPLLCEKLLISFLWFSSLLLVQSKLFVVRSRHRDSSDLLVWCGGLGIGAQTTGNW